LHRAVRADDAGWDLGVLRLFLQLHPVFVAAALAATAYRDRKSVALLGRVFRGGLKDGISELLGGQRLDFLAIFVAELDREADTVEVYAQALVRIVAEDNFNGEYAACIWRLFWEFVFVSCGIGPGKSGDGQPFVGFKGSSFERVLPGRGGRGGADRASECDHGHEQKGKGQSSHPVIINFSHPDAFDS
jgi:hypothetical protein